jgi:LmbE family N-acetylglucosaminyl deacetylase
MRLNSIADITHDYRHIYLSPHYDDAILSCGGTIAFQGMSSIKTLIVTIFGGVGKKGEHLSALASNELRLKNMGTTAAEAIALRQQEDASACNTVAADYLWLDFPDAMFRSYTNSESLFGTVERADLALEEQIAAILLEIHTRAPLAVVYAPLGIGHHVDHQLVCSSADRLVHQQANVKFYEDFPYVTVPGALADRQKELGFKFEDEMVEVSAQIRIKEDAIAHYHSQIATLFTNEEKMRATVDIYHGSIRTRYPGIKIERYWRW